MLPAAASLKRQGANKGATTAFLISTPESGVDSIAVTYALLDPLMTVIRPIAAFLTAMAGGILENSITYSEPEPIRPLTLNRRSHGEEGTGTGSGKGLIAAVKAGVSFAVNEVWAGIALWFFFGVILAGAITAAIPDDFLATFLGGGISSMLLMLVIGIPLYICATASTPIAAALILKGVSPGAALVFLLVGPATNITSLSVLVPILGKRSTFRYLVVVAVMAVVFGLVVDLVYSGLGISPQAVVGAAAELVPDWLRIIAAVILILLSVKPVLGLVKRKFPGKKGETTFKSGFPE